MGEDLRRRSGGTTLLLIVLLSVLGGCATYVAPPTGLEAQKAHPWSAGATPAEVRSTGATGGGAGADAFDRVFVQCAVVQGNGFNWAATLGWLSSQMDLVAHRAAAYQQAHPAQRVAVDVRCFTGSSSGGATAGLYDQLLSNAAIVGPAAASGETSLITPAAAAELSRALMFLALSADLRGEKLGLAFTAIGAWTGMLDRGSRGVPVSFWRASTTPARTNAIFGRWIRAASVYEPAWFEELVGDDPFSIPAFSRRSASLGHAPKDDADRRMATLAKRARDILDRETRNTAQYPDRVGDGICVTSMTARLEETELPLAFDDLLLVVACNGDTFERLLEAPALAAMLEDEAAVQASARLRLAAADEWDALLNVTVREPLLVTPLSGQLLNPPIALDAVAAWNGRALTPIAPDDAYLMLGGFAGPRMQAWPATALLAARVGELAAAGVEADGRMVLFGRTENRDDPRASFAQRVVLDFFTPPAEAAGEGGLPATLTTYYAWQDEYCDVNDAPGLPPLDVRFYRTDWNLAGSGPAALSGRSRELAALGYNLGKVQTAVEDYPLLDPGWFETFLFAPEDTEAYVPSPPEGGLRCRLTGRGI